MTDAATIAAGLQSLKAAFDIGKALLKLGIAADISARISEMNQKILTAQESAIAAREYQSALLEQIRTLEKQIADLEAWDAEAQTYELRDVRTPRFGLGAAFAYAPKEGTHTSEPAHFICAACYQDRRKSILQRQMLQPGQCDTLLCQRCRSVLYLTGHPYPQHFGLKPKPV